MSDIGLTDNNVDIGVLIVRNVPQAIEPLESIPSITEGGPFAIRKILGWVVFGSLKGGTATCVKISSIRVEYSYVTLDNILTKCINTSLWMSTKKRDYCLKKTRGGLLRQRMAAREAWLSG